MPLPNTPPASTPGPGVQEQMTALAKALGLPKPPELRLPDLPPLVGGCNWEQLAGALGPTVRDALAAQFSDPAVQGLIRGGLEGARAQVLAYVSQLDREKNRLLADVTGMNAARGGLAQGRALLGQARSALGQPGGSPLAGSVLNAVADACPAVGGLLAYGENALSVADDALGALDSTLDAVQSKIEGLTSLEGLTGQLLAEVDAHLDILPALLSSLGGQVSGGET